MKVKLNDDQIRAIADEDELIVDGETWSYIEQEEVMEMESNGLINDGEDEKYETFIYQRPSDNKYFRITVGYARYGYRDYGYEEYLQDYTAYEVEKKEIIRTLWCNVN